MQEPGFSGGLEQIKVNSSFDKYHADSTGSALIPGYAAEGEMGTGLRRKLWFAIM
jgi:hypothetical protein